MLRLKAALGVGKSHKSDADSPAMVWLDTANKSLAQRVEILTRQCELWEAECSAMQAEHANEVANLQAELAAAREISDRLSSGTPVEAIVTAAAARCQAAEQELAAAKSEAASLAAALAQRDREDAEVAAVAARNNNNTSPTPSAGSTAPAPHIAALEAARAGLEQLVEEQAQQLDRLTAELGAALARSAGAANDAADKADASDRRIAALQAELAACKGSSSSEGRGQSSTVTPARTLEIRVEVLERELEAERRANDKAEAARALLETQLREVKGLLEDAEDRIRGRGAAGAANFEVRVADLETQMDEEAAKCEEAERNVRRLEKRCRELSSAADEKERLLTEQRLIADKLQGKVELLRQQLALNEEALERSNLSKRKITRDFDEQTEKVVALETEIRQLRGRVRRQVRAAKNANDSD